MRIILACLLLAGCAHSRHLGIPYQQLPGNKILVMIKTTEEKAALDKWCSKQCIGIPVATGPNGTLWEIERKH